MGSFELDDRSAVGIGSRQERLEDLALITGRDGYTSDLAFPGALHAVFVRSTEAHARITAIDTAEARTAPGVVAVLTSDDVAVPAVFLPMQAELIDEAYHRRPLASATVRFVGEVVAVVLAESEAAAEDAAGLVVVDYEPLPVVIDPIAAASVEAPLLFPETGTNVAFDEPFEAGEHAAADVRVHTSVMDHRMAVAPMEGLAIVARPEPEGGLTLWVSTQMPHAFRDLTAARLGMDPAQLRVLCPAVGGGFGGKTPNEPDYVLVAAVARHVKRTVRWTQGRGENLLTMQARGGRFDVVVEATREGRVTSLQVDELADVGAYPGTGIGMALTTRSMATGVYDIPHARFHLRCVATNTAPVGAFRGAGRPEATHFLERAMDVLAKEVGLDPVEVRRRNFIAPRKFPYRSVMGENYDSADFDKALSVALNLVDYDALRASQRRRGPADKLLGIGVSTYIEVSAGNVGLEADQASVEILEDGTARIAVGTCGHGQGHWTTYAQVVSGVLGVPVEDVLLVQSDTARVPSGRGTGGSRSAQIGGSALHLASLEILARARNLAAQLLDCDVEAVVVVAGQGLGLASDPGKVLTWGELAAAASDDSVRPADVPPGLSAVQLFDQKGGTSPFGCHIAVVAVDQETGLVELVRMIAVDDCGVVINPLLATGQVHGGLAAGIGHVLFEQSTFDTAGNPTSTTFAEYAMPSAAELPSYETAHTTTPTTMNPLGAKGLGEAGTTGSVAAVHNAVMDALGQAGVEHLDTPLTPFRVWSALRAAEASQG
jgi:carbon-monoxide dehydrogenase large subunit